MASTLRTCRSCTAGHTANCDRFPVLSDYGMQPLSGIEFGGMLSDLIRVPHAAAMLAPISPALDPVALGSVSDNVLDGYRAVALKSGGKVQLRSRNDNDFSTRYSGICAALSSIPERNGTRWRSRSPR